MDTKTFFENFETIANAPGGIARLRELILNLAVRGKLVPQRIGEKSISVTAADGKYEIPNSWKWVKISTVSDFVNGFAFKSEEYIEDGIGIVRMSDLKLGQIATQGMKRVPSKYLTILDENLHISPGDLVIGMSGSIGKPCFNFTNETFLLNQRVGKFVPHSVEKKYLAIVLQTLENSFLEMSAGSGIKNLSTKQIKDAELPLPPQNEQKRIAAKVDELMALCDQLEATQQQRDSLRTSARTSAIDAISTASTAEELGAAWKRINQNWTTFADTPDSISSLRSLILDLAVCGRLLPKATNWKTCTLGEITKIRTGKLDANASSPDGEFPFFTCAKDPLKISSFSYDTECVLLAGNGNFDVNYYSGKFDAYQRTYIIEARNQDELFVPYLYRFMQGHSRKLLEQSIGGVIKYIKIGFLTHADFELPSLPEQKKIVAKVDELMTLCDELENHLRIRNEAQLRLCRAVTSSAAA